MTFEHTNLNCSPLGIGPVLQVVRTLENVVASSFGPHSSKTMLTTATGKIMITSNGTTILSSLHFSHPVAKLIIEAMSKMFDYTGDGSKTFIVYVHAILREVEQFLKRTRDQKILSSSNPYSTSDAICIRLGLQKTYESLVHHLCPDLQHYLGSCLRVCDGKLHEAGGVSRAAKLQGFDDVSRSCSHHQRPEPLHNAAFEAKAVGVQSAAGDFQSFSVHSITRFLRTCLDPHYTRDISNHLAGVLVDFVGIDGSPRESFPSHLEVIIRNFDFFSVRVPLFSYDQTHSLPGVLIDREFASYTKVSDEQPNMIMLRGSLEHDSGASNKDTIKINSLSDVLQVSNLKRGRVEQFLKRCFESRVRLILSSEKVPEFALQICHEMFISVVSSVSNDDLDRLECLSDGFSLTSPNDEITERHLIKMDSFQPLSLGFKKFSRLIFVNERQKSRDVKTAVLCAPTEGLVFGLQANALNCLKTLCVTVKTPTGVACVSDLDTSKPRCEPQDFYSVKSDSVHHLFEPTSQENPQMQYLMNIVPGGGMFEFLVHCILEAIIPSHIDVQSNAAYRLISAAVLCVPQLLHKNLSVSKRTLCRDFMNVKSEMIRNITKEQFCIINERGNVQNRGEMSLESLEIKTHILLSSIQTVIQIMRIDAIVGVNAKPVELHDAK